MVRVKFPFLYVQPSSNSVASTLTPQDLMTRHEAEKLKLREGVELLQKQVGGGARTAEQTHISI